MTLTSWQKNALSVVVITVGGFILFNVAFMLAALVINGLSMFMGGRQQTFLGFGVYFALLLFLSWLVFRSKLNHLVKATYLTMPLMAVLVMEGVVLYQQPQWVPLAVGAVICGAILFYIYNKKLPWFYYFSVLYVAALALYIVMAGVEI
jgi:cytochrome b